MFYYLSLSQVHFFNSFFHKQLVAKGYDGVKRWTKKVRRKLEQSGVFPVFDGFDGIANSLTFMSQLNFYARLLICLSESGQTAAVAKLLQESRFHCQPFSFVWSGCHCWQPQS